MITGYNDNFNRTVVAGFGTATSGQAYTVVGGAASQFNVTPSTATILPTALGERFGWVDRQTSDIDVTVQVALSAIPATNLMTAGVIFKRFDVANYYNGTMMVAAGGAISLRFSRVLAGGLSTLASVSIGVTYVANTFYNLRVASYWSNTLQANVLQSKLWVVGGTEPGGWMVSITDAGLTQYTTGNGAGLLSRDEATVPGAVTAQFRNLVARSYGLPVPAGTDPMCYDPAIAYPRQTAVESLADAADAVVATFDPFADLARLFPRVRVSASSFTINSAIPVVPTWTTTEFNIDTETNLGYNTGALFLPAGLWLATFEVQFSPAAATDFATISVSGGSPSSFADAHMKTNQAQLNMDSQGGSGHISVLVQSPDPAVAVSVTASINPNTATTYTVRYAALSAIKISDYFS